MCLFLSIGTQSTCSSRVESARETVAKLLGRTQVSPRQLSHILKTFAANKLSGNENLVRQIQTIFSDKYKLTDNTNTN